MSKDATEIIVKKLVGRPSMGITKKVSITLPEDEWEEVAEIIKNGHAASYSEYFRLIHNGANR
jgi:hypothetical protein